MNKDPAAGCALPPAKHQQKRDGNIIGVKKVKGLGGLGERSDQALVAAERSHSAADGNGRKEGARQHRDAELEQISPHNTFEAARQRVDRREAGHGRRQQGRIRKFQGPQFEKRRVGNPENVLDDKVAAVSHSSKHKDIDEPPIEYGRCCPQPTSRFTAPIAGCEDLDFGEDPGPAPVARKEE